MSLKIIKSEIDNFLKSKNPEVMSIKGLWGVGKTYTWNKYLLEAKNQNRIAFKKYSYVSLFGICSLGQLKYSIFENLVDCDLIGQRPGIDSLKNNTISIIKALGLRGVSILSKNGALRDYGAVFESLSFLYVSESLICIDDLERAGEGLSIKDVLGLVSQLKEQKKCKVIFLLNDKEEGLKDYEKFKEKTIDIELEFSPTSLESANIALDKALPFYSIVVDHIQRLEIKNIRIVKKIERQINNGYQFIKEFDTQVIIQFIRTVVLYAYCYYIKDEKIPSLDYVTSLDYTFLGIGDDDDQKDKPNIEKEWKLWLLDYGYEQTDDFDKVIAESIKSGIFNQEELVRQATIKNIEAIKQNADNSFSKAWELYHGNFNLDQKTVIEALFKSFKENVISITPNNLEGTVKLFRELNEAEKATEIINFYIEARKYEKDLFNLSSNNHFDIKDDEIRKKFSEQYERNITSSSFIEVLDRISENKGWFSDDELILSRVSVDEFYHLFKTSSGKKLSRYIIACLRYGRIINAGKEEKAIHDNALAALIKIGKESEINRRRLRKYDIVIPEEA